ncbi:MAG: FAD:protein FMN transferase [Spirochaetota bacterium]
MARRWTARSAGAATAILVATAAALLLAGCESRPPEPHSETELLLGTTVSVTTYGDVPDEVYSRAFDRVLEIEERMSTSEEDYTMTELMAVNDAAGETPIDVSEDTFHVVAQAVEYSRLTGGAFDVSVQPLVSLWGIGTDRASVPPEEEIQTAVAAVDHRAVRLDEQNQEIFLPEPGMGIDVGGIAKGYAADEVARILREEGVQSALLDFGGNIQTVGTKPDGSAWRIGVQVPDAARGQYIGIADVVDLSVVTSGTYERYFVEDGVRYHHILDTKTGYPVRNGLDSVTIIAGESIEADALSTAVFAMGLEDGLAFVEGLADAEAFFVTSEREVIMSSGMNEYFELTNEDYTLADR